MTPAGSIPVSAQALELLAVQARRNGTQSAFIDIAVQWALQASQEIDRLTRERDEARRECFAMVTDLSVCKEATNGYLAEAEVLRAERDAMAKDAERFRWLLDQGLPDWMDVYHQHPDRVRAAIDAQIEQERSEQGEGA